MPLLQNGQQQPRLHPSAVTEQLCTSTEREGHHCPLPKHHPSRWPHLPPRQMIPIKGQDIRSTPFKEKGMIPTSKPGTPRTKWSQQSLESHLILAKRPGSESIPSAASNVHNTTIFFSWSGQLLKSWRSHQGDLRMWKGVVSQWWYAKYEPMANHDF